MTTYAINVLEVSNEAITRIGAKKHKEVMNRLI
jgi:hypothetical protein